MTPVSKSERSVALVLLAAFFLFGVFDHSFWGTNDSREGGMIWDMYRHNVWVTPLLNGQHYLEKPPLFHWTSVLLCRLFGTTNEGLMRLPAALYGFGAVLIAWLWSRQLGRERAGLIGAFLCATSALYFEYTRIVLTDATLTLMVMLSLYLFWKAYTAAPPTRGPYSVFIFVSALAFYAKGLIGPGFVWVTVCAFLLYQGRFKLLFRLLIFYALALAVILLPWVLALWKTGGRDMLVSVFWDNQFGRFLSFSNPNLPKDPYFVHKESIFYYLFHLPGRLMPWTLLVIPAMFSWFRKRTPFREPLTVFLRFALLSMLLILHVSSAKTGCYALPLFPIIFLMTGLWLDESVRRGMSKIDRILVHFTLIAVLTLLAVLPTAYIVLFLFHHYFIWGPGGPAAVKGLIIEIGALAVAIFVLLKYRRAFPAFFPALLCVAALLVINITALIPAIDFQKSYKPFVQVIDQEMATGRRIAQADDDERDLGAFTFYLNARVDVISPKHEIPRYLFGENRLSGVIIPRSYWPKVEPLLAGQSYTIRQAENAGIKSRQFLLILNNKPQIPNG